MNEYLIRLATESDGPSLGRLGALLLDMHYGFDGQRFMTPHPNSTEGYARFLQSQLREKDAVILVAERHEAVVGYVYAGLEPRSWKELRETAGFIHDIVVEDSSRRLGIARSLVEAAVEWLREQGAPRVILWTAERNPVAQDLFRHLGFRRTMIEMTREV